MTGVPVVTDDGRTHLLTHGEEAVFGRGRACALRFGHDPEDTRVSRRAGSLSLLPDTVLIRNLSTTQELYLVAPQAADRILEPLSATTALPHTRFVVEVPGADDHRYRMRIDASALGRGVGPGRAASTDSGEKPTKPAGTGMALTPAQQRILAALCEPLLTGHDEPATYNQIAARLTLKPGYVRNVLKTVRESLSGEGVTGMVPDEQDVAPDLRIALARWAVRHQIADLTHLPGRGSP